MNKIILLDEKMISKISAGEVVERPASIVKELVENSIDASSKNISIEITNGGISYIKVLDDGIGMSAVDAILAFGRHATSKIKTVDDLYNIETLGFRGEALASISAISKVTLKTKEENELYGTLIKIDGGKIKEKNKCGCEKGTAIEVYDIFYNTPARRKFLKRPSTESTYITNLVSKMCLSHPNISFKYIKDKKLELVTSGDGNINDVILRLFGKDLYSSLIFANYESEYIKVNMYLCKPSFNKSNRNMQMLFVNGRYVKNKVYNIAIDEAYKTLIPRNRYPIIITYLQISPKQVDVNVHPSKMEIKFSNEKEIFEIIYKTIKKGLAKTNLIPEVKSKNNFSVTMEKEDINNGEQTKIIHSEYMNYFPSSKDSIKSGNKDLLPQEVYERENVDVLKSGDYEIYEKNINKNRDYKIVGTLFSTYIIIERKDAIYIIDQHAAHERILYEKYMSEYNKVQGKQTTIPILINIEPGDMEILSENENILRKLGYKYECFGDNSIILREVPIILGQPESRQLFIDIIDRLRDNNFSHNINLKEENIIMMACKSAVKAMDSLSDDEIYQLFNDLKITESPYTCPHGRPVIISIKKYELEKMFKRVM